MFWQKTRDKKEVPVSVFGETREDETGAVISYFLAFIDMSEIKKKTEELQEKIEQLERFERLTVGRELKMVGLKKEIERLKRKAGEK